MSKTLKSENGHTLIEMILVLVIIGILASVAVPRFIDVGGSATMRALYTGVTEINSRESTLWAKILISDTGWQSDELLFAQLDAELGSEFKWTPRVKIDGAMLHYKEKALKLKRIASTPSSPGRWEVRDKN
jgi:prepilin-type N-terminal cleavage/methylation domain-containing protein